MRENAAYRPDIDGLRAVAVLAVLAFHAAPRLLPGGFVGVDVFFVVSGYLITGLILRQVDAGAFTFGGFYLHRFRRIFPALALVLAACLLGGWGLLLADEYALLGRHVAAGGVFANNIALWRESGYFDVAADLKPLLHLWSLGVEEQFYLFWPLALVLAARRRGNLDAGIAALIAASFGLELWLNPRAPASAFYLLPPRLWALLLGAALVRLEARGARPRAGAADLESALGLALILGSFFLVPNDRHSPGAAAVFPTVGAVLLMRAGPDAWVNRRLLSGGAAVRVGLISYPLYLWHWPLIALGRIVWSGRPSAAYLAGAVAASFALAELTYRCVELPVRGLVARHRGPRWVPFAALAAPVALCAALGAAVSARGGLPGRAANAGMKANLEQLSWFDADPACLAELGLDRVRGGKFFCSRSGGARPPSVAVLGDSTANHLYPGLAKLFAARGEGVINAGASTCPPFGGVSFGANSCPEVDALIDAYLRRTPSIKTVILAFAPWDVKSYRFAGEDLGPELPPRFAATRRLVEGAVARLAAQGKRVVVTFDNPAVGIDPHSCIGRPWRDAGDCLAPAAEVAARMEPYVSFYRETFARLPGVCVFSQDPIFRRGDSYRAMEDGVLLYRDDHHLTYRGSAAAAAAFAAGSCMPRGPY